MMKGRDYMCKVDLKNVNFTVPLDKSWRRLVGLVWEWNLYKVLCLWFRLGPAPRDFTKKIESPNIPFAPSKYQNFDLPGRHVVNVSINRETSSRKRHHNLSPLTFRVFNKPKKISNITGTNNQIFRSCDKLNTNDSCFNRRQSEGILQEYKIIFSIK